ncbi:hypothetical protein HanRHA438_Chr08g0355491 [Helianthus annuus]|uniref:Sphingomyelin phosphodiesterase n=1 Tax=Helianthus annuus TaxID=4232 RepID=A0A251U6V2_HELAN|nr:uncharacterized protein LOC110873149 [Helianthus annuus]KAF5795805.1 hypothetical protein HanXRQr2_Chr08g0344041 [Helianthus annuus]KAJ0553916.1 hypothetical protein HanHA89_Chr08g0301771 [Helianthus annuus]KAJ0719559.1 hypothetical protein HanLR1_Chr08g0283111 [Helianthus annuus]KAJ0722793.1 hypothetical protein HanOQP8_Chr08g0290701 [Helianthus annuus]KAJ0898319.1 hypothetical protein HanRHA438_Chr08g0355491 [Helianthus annuus]
MIPHTYSTDAQSQSADLAATIAAASTPEQISAVCAAVELFLNKHSPDQSRWFFSITFPTLICRLFGFDEVQNPSSNRNGIGNGWIDVLAAVDDAEVSGKVFQLFNPTGVLLSSVVDVDRLSVVKYVFPIERLPEWIRLTLQNGRNCGVLSQLCPLLKGRLIEGVSCQVQLNIIEYYLFWFAYYPVSKGSCENRTVVSSRVSKRSRLESWASKSVSVLGNVRKLRGNERKNGDGGSLYIQLLNAYLRFFVPLNDLNAQSPYRSSLLHYSSSYDTSVSENAEFFVHTLVHFWIVDNDFSPLPVKLCKSFGVVLPSWPVLTELPPTAGLGEVVNVFVKYLNSSLLSNSIEGCDQVELSKVATWGGTGSVDMKYMDAFPSMGSIGYWNSCIQRPVYRYILRTFLFFPVETSLKNVSQVFSLWVNYMEPWAVSLDEFPETHANVDSLKKDSIKEVNVSHSREYTSSWQGYVLSNYLFYSSLVMHFIGFAHKFIHTDPELIVQMVSKVVNVLTSSRELLDIIENVETVFHSSPAGSSKSMLNSLYRFIPSIREQLQDWEDGLSETDADGSFMHENWNKDLKLFSTSEDGGQQLLQLLALRAESELQAISSENLQSSLQLLTCLKARMGCLFGSNMMTYPTTPESSKQAEKSRHEVFSPKTAGKRHTTDIRYKGDWMKRPISNDEVAWLANLLVKLSWWLNDILGLNSWENDDVGPSTWSYVEVSGDAGSKVYGVKDTSRLGREAVKLMRQHGIRVNLRILASKKIVLVLFIAIAFSALKRMFSDFPVA